MTATMAAIRVISSATIQAPSHNNADSTQKIDLTPWDLQFLPVETIQKGLLFPNPINKEAQIHHLKHSFSSTLSFFPPLTGRLAIIQQDNNTVSSHILCNNAGALFVHATAHHVTLSHVLQPKYVPSIVHSFFQLNGVKNHEGTTQPLLAVQVTELLDSIFIGCTINHVVADGSSFWHFINSWAQISRGLDKLTKLPSFDRWFFDGIDRPIRFPFTVEKEKQHSQNLNPQSPPERIFHFTKERIAQLKWKANAEASTDKISSLQALLSHVWRSVIRCKHFNPEEEIHYMLIIGVRPRMVPPLADYYFGNAAMFGDVTMKAGELLEGGVGKGAWEMNKVISVHSHEKVKNHYECWVRTPRLLTLGSVANSNSLVTSSSPRFDFYGNDFGWGKPVAVRCGVANKGNGKITVFAGAEEGSIDIEMCFPHEILEAMGNDPHFMDPISN
ncbi:hypothetical protein VNO77_25260 [Canavalia gladiata]|uniref:HXXXD-type acyl-transferase family protein n=1 Tax=Canavalia gladiata TaxID=3824 RepID=A0AAN9L7U3_CANGL